MARLRAEQIFGLTPDHVEGLTVELKGKATATFSEAHFYVDLLNGHDTNLGTKDSPKQTIQAAINALPVFINHPVEIRLAKGIYTETVQFNQHVLGANGFIIIRPQENATVVLSGDNKLNHCIIVDFAQGVCIQDITIQGYKAEAVKVINSAKIDMNKCVLRDNFVALSLSNQASTYTLNSCVFLNNRIGVRVVNTSTVDIQSGFFEANNVAISAETLSTVEIKGAKISSNNTAFESKNNSVITFSSSVITENDNVAKVELATILSHNDKKSSLISNNTSGFIGVRSAKIDLRNVDMVNNRKEDILIDSGAVAMLEDCSMRKSSSSFGLSAKRGTQVHLLGSTRSRVTTTNLYDPGQEDNIFG